MKPQMKNGFEWHCRIVKVLIDLGINAATRPHIRDAIRHATYKTNDAMCSKGREAARYASEPAKKLYEIDPKDRNVVADHAVPISKIMELIGAQPTEEEIRTCVRRYAKLVLSTIDEHKILQDSGLTHKMPDNWDLKDLDARYKHCQINITALTRIKKRGRNDAAHR